MPSSASTLPITREALLLIKGVGPRNAVYADEVLAITRRYYSTDSAHMRATAAPETTAKPVPLMQPAPASMEQKKAVSAPRAAERSDPVASAGLHKAAGPNDEQQRAVDQALKGQSVFITGSAGTGKSFLLRFLVARLRGTHGKDAVAVTASTGIAALNIFGMTLHSFAGIGLAKDSKEQILATVSRNKRALTRW